MGNFSIGFGGIGFTSLLTLIFVVAKLWGKIDWSWLWVLSPLWISITLSLSILGIILIIIWWNIN